LDSDLELRKYRARQNSSLCRPYPIPIVLFSYLFLWQLQYGFRDFNELRQPISACHASSMIAAAPDYPNRIKKPEQCITACQEN
jgi:hypothetical protein